MPIPQKSAHRIEDARVERAVLVSLLGARDRLRSIQPLDLALGLSGAEEVLYAMSQQDGVDRLGDEVGRSHLDARSI